MVLAYNVEFGPVQKIHRTVYFVSWIAATISSIIPWSPLQLNCNSRVWLVSATKNEEVMCGCSVFFLYYPLDRMPRVGVSWRRSC